MKDSIRGKAGEEQNILRQDGKAGVTDGIKESRDASPGSCLNDSGASREKYEFAVSLLKKQEDKLKSYCEMLSRLTEENKLLSAGDFNSLIKHYNNIIEKMRDEIQELSFQKDSLLASQNEYFTRIISEKDGIIAGLGHKYSPKRRLNCRPANVAGRIWGLAVLAWLLFIKIAVDFYMLGLRLFFKKRIFPGG